MNSPNRLKARLKDGDLVLGTWCYLPSSAVTNVIGSSGLDFVIIDMEHGPHTFETVDDMIRAAEVEGCAPLVRVARNDESLILNALDLGPQGVVIPHIESRSDMEAAVSGAKYYPLGHRGFSSFTRAGRYSLENVRPHSEAQNEQTMVILILEGRLGIASLDDILTVEAIDRKVDVIYVGVYDLAQAVGLPGQVDHPAVRSLLEASVQKIRRRGVAAGGYVAKNRGDLQQMCEMGMQFITLLPDCTVLFHAYESLRKDFASVRASREARCQP